MPYLGNTPSTSFATVVKDTFNGGSTGYTLSKVATTNSVSVFVENVRQEPTSAYSVSGTTLTFTATTPSGTGNIYVLHMNPTTTTTHPAAQNLTAVNGTLTGTLAVTGESTLTGDATLSRSNQNGTVRLNLENTGAGGSTDYSEIKFNSTAGSTVTSIVQHRNNSGMNIGTSTAHPLTLITSGNTAMSVDANGHVTKPLQPCFQARPTSTISNIADGGSQTLAMATEVFDQNADYDTSNYNFTAPVTGKYLLTLNLRVQSLDTDSAYFQAIILTSNKEYQSIISTNRFSGDPLYWYIAVSVVADMDATDTAIPRVFIEGSNTHQVDIETDSYFSGCLLA